jgi:L-ascorbate metabolism protein UlaG (beta-lactamase superfamily)
MKISKYIHSCVLVEEKGEKLLIDPGPFTFIEKLVDPSEFEDVHTILITHNHYDHYDPEALRTILRNNPEAKILANGVMVEELGKENIPAEIFEEGETVRGNFKLRAFFAEHEPIPFPAPPNTAFIVNDVFLHPGDSFDASILLHKIPILALPVAAPWLTWVGSLDFAYKYRPEQIVPVHDGFIKDFFTQKMYEAWGNLSKEKGITFNSLQRPGQSIEV